MNILCYRSPYLRRALVSNKKNNNGVLARIRLPNILPEIFQIILRYIYGGILSANRHDTSDIFKVLVAADELCLQELADSLQKYLIENKSDWMKRHFEFTHRASFQSNSLLELQQFCTDFMVKSPEKIFQSIDFTSLPEKSLVQLIRRDDLQMKEVEIWENVLKWGHAQNSTPALDPDTWSNDDFRVMENTLQRCLPLIRFFSLSSKEFIYKVSPYKKLLKNQLYVDLLNSYMDPDSEPDDNIPLPRNIKTDGIIDSEIVNLNIVSIISRWIDKVDVNSKFAHLRELYLPYKFELLIRGSRDGFTPDRFHALCNYKPITVTFIKVRGTEEILGGYNPLVWSTSGGWGKTKDSFIFSIKNNTFFNDIVLSNVRDANFALNCLNKNHGPFFGGDLLIYSTSFLQLGHEFVDYNNVFCRHEFYEKKIRDSEGFSMENYEVFQLIKRNM